MRRPVCISRPFVHRLDPSTICNLKCPNCESHSVETKEKRMMNLDHFQIIIAKIKQHCIRASLYDTGEPLLNKDIYKMIKYASDNHISTSISTNFSLFDRKKDLLDLIESKLTLLQPDLDGITQNVYSIYRKGGSVSKVKKSIESVIKFKKNNGAKLPIIEPQVILFEHVVQELPKIEEYLLNIGIDRIKYKTDSWGFNPAKSMSKKITTNSSRCFWLYMGCMIRPDGNVYPCCGRGFNRLPYGNILNESIDDIWNNKYYRFSRNLFVRGPSLSYSPEMEKVPCLSCSEFSKLRNMLRPN